jgi:hypothetical protein
MKEAMMERNVYNAESLDRVIKYFEERYALSTPEFYELHRAESDRLSSIPGFHRHTWASFYRDVRRVSGDDFVAHAEQTLALS